EDEVRARRRNDIQAVSLDIIEVVVAKRVGDCQPVLRPAHAHSRALDRMTVDVNNLTGHGCISRRRCRSALARENSEVLPFESVAVAVMTTPEFIVIGSESYVPLPGTSFEP